MMPLFVREKIYNKKINEWLIRTKQQRNKIGWQLGKRAEAMFLHWKNLNPFVYIQSVKFKKVHSKLRQKTHLRNKQETKYDTNFLFNFVPENGYSVTILINYEAMS